MLAEIQLGRIDRLRYLLLMGVDVNKKIPIGLKNNDDNIKKIKKEEETTKLKYFKTTLLHTAAELGNAEIVELLLNNNASPYQPISYQHSLQPFSKNITTNVCWFGRIPVDLAAMGGHRQVIKILIEWSKSHSVTSNFYIRSSYPYNFLDILEELGTKVDKMGTLLFAVVELGGPEEMIDYLISMGEPIEAIGRGGYRPIHVAVSNGNVSHVRKFLNFGANLARISEHNNPFHIAAEKGNLEVMTTLIHHGKGNGIFVNAGNFNGDKPLHLASLYGHFDMVNLLLASGARADFFGEGNATPLHSAAKQGHLNVVQSLLTNNKAIISMPMRENNTALHLAIISRHTEIAICLLENGAATTTANWDDDYPIHIAAKQGDKEVVALLLYKDTAEVDTVNSANREGWTPLMYACHRGHLDISSMLIKAKSDVNVQIARNGYTALIWAVIAGHKAIVELLLDNGANIDHTDAYGNTALYHAVENGNEEIVKFMLSKPIDMGVGKSALEVAVEHGVQMIRTLLDNKVSPDNSQALLKAIERKQEDVAALLLNSGASGNVTKPYTNTTGLVLAIYHGLGDLVELLIEKGAVVNKSIVHYAVHMGNADIVATLLKHSGPAELEADTFIYFGSFFSAAVMDTLTKCVCDGCSPLHCAVVKGNERIVRSLLEHNAVVNSFNSRLSTPLHLAVACKRTELIALLIDKGASTEARDMMGLTPLLSAILDTSPPPSLSPYHTYSLPTPISNPIPLKPPVLDLMDLSPFTSSPSKTPMSISSSSSSSSPLSSSSSIDANSVLSPSPPTRADIVRALVSKGAKVNTRLSYNYPLFKSPPLVFPVPPSLSNLPPPYVATIFPCSTFTCTPLEHILWNRWATCNSKVEVDWEIVKELMKGDLNKQGGVVGGDTLLHQAVLMLDLKVIEILVQGGFDVNAVNANGRTPLQLGEDFISKCKEKYFLGTVHVEAEFEKVKRLLNSNATETPSPPSFWPPLPFIRFPPSSSSQKNERLKITVKRKKIVVE